MADFNPDQAPGTHVKDIHDNEDSKLAERGIRFGAFLSIYCYNRCPVNYFSKITPSYS